MCMGSQGENPIHHLSHIADFRLECCIEGQKLKNEISGRNKRNFNLSIFQTIQYRELASSPTTLHSEITLGLKITGRNIHFQKKQGRSLIQRKK